MRARLSTRVSVWGPISVIRRRAKGTHLAGSGPGAFFPGLSGRAVVAMYEIIEETERKLEKERDGLWVVQTPLSRTTRKTKEQITCKRNGFGEYGAMNSAGEGRRGGQNVAVVGDNEETDKFGRTMPAMSRRRCPSSRSKRRSQHLNCLLDSQSCLYFCTSHFQCHR